MVTITVTGSLSVAVLIALPSCILATITLYEKYIAPRKES